MSRRSKLGLKIEAGLREAIAYRRGEIALVTRVVDTVTPARMGEIRKALPPAATSC
jgi:hypothetical protein